MTVKQIYALLNKVAEEVYGKRDVDLVNTADFYSLGETVLTNDTEKYLNTLVDRIGRIVIRTLDVATDFPAILRDSFTFGAILSKVNIQPLEAQAQKAWNVGDNDFTADQFKIDKPNISAKYWKGAAAFEFDLTIPDTMFRSAFTSETEMSNFISGVMNSLETSMTLYLNNLTHGVVAGAIAEKLKTTHYVNLLSMYNTAHSTSLTAPQALETAAFLKYAGRIIGNYLAYLEVPSVLYNEGNLVRATTRDNLHCWLATAFASAYRVYLESDTFNKELVSLPGFYEYKYIQGTGNSYAINDEKNTSVLVNTADGSTVGAAYIIGVLADRQAIATGLTDRFTAADRNNRQRYTNYTNGATLQHVIDLSENMVVFTLGDATVIPPETQNSTRKVSK